MAIQKIRTGKDTIMLFMVGQNWFSMSILSTILLIRTFKWPGPMLSNVFDGKDGINNPWIEVCIGPCDPLKSYISLPYLFKLGAWNIFIFFKLWFPSCYPSKNWLPVTEFWFCFVNSVIFFNENMLFPKSLGMIGWGECDGLWRLLLLVLFNISIPEVPPKLPIIYLLVFLNNCPTVSYLPFTLFLLY